MIDLQVGVKVLIKNEENRYLLLRRSIEKYPDVIGRWDIPGGRIEAGVPLIDNLVREVKEETGLDLNREVTLIGAQDILAKPRRHVVRLTYQGKASGEIELDKSENDEYGWFTFSELMEHHDLSWYLKLLLQESTLVLI